MDSKTLIRSIKVAVNKLNDGNQSIEYKVRQIDQIIRYTISFLSDKENLFFASYYAKYSFLRTKYKISTRDQFLFHVFRKITSQKKRVDNRHIELGLYVINNITKLCLGEQVYPTKEEAKIGSSFDFPKRGEHSKFIPYLTSYLKKIDKQNQCFIIELEDGEEEAMLLEDEEDAKGLRNYISQLEQWKRLPIKIALFDCTKRNNVITPSYYVLEPDFLIDVTSVSEAFDAFGVSIAGYGLRKMIDKGASISLHIGNLANVILDELIYDPYISFNHFMNNIFQISPLAFAAFTNEQVRQLIETIRKHYENIKKVVSNDFKNQGITGKSVFVEPSFYAPRIGIQGRFDLLHQEDEVMNIIELKSGKSYRPNAYGLNNSHYHQTLLYDLILESNFGKKTKRNNFILYSAESEKALRYAPTIKSEQIEALRVRNQIYIEECRMQNDILGNSFIKDFLTKYEGKLSGFKGQDINELKKVYSKLNESEKAYWESSFSFLSREYALSKTGDELSETSKGLSGIWQLDRDQKHERFLLLNDLKIVHDNSQENDPHLLLEYTMETVALSNFRKGDIIILYPNDALGEYQMKSQIFKCTLSEVEHDHVVVRLRSKQMNNKAFNPKKRWNIERDILDSSFSKSFKQLFHFAYGEKEKRGYVLGLCPPEKYSLLPLPKIPKATNIQNEVIMKAIASENYHLIWGPPGTGKTSIILKEIIAHYYKSTQTRMLIIGYTNRAVDEICSAIETIDEKIDYIRIGSKYSCGEKYKPRLLNAHLESINDRKRLKHLLHSQQIYIGTLASIIGKPELFELLQFGICIVDEASQILEASLAGLLTKTKKFILIGDHLQLPAIVLQKPHQSKINEESLNSLGFRSYAESLFERMYRRCINQNWKWSYSQLKEQGRMHLQIMNVANDLFYNNGLQLLPDLDRLTKEYINIPEKDELIKNRLVYIPTPTNDKSSSRKVNIYQAKTVIKVISRIINSYSKLNKKLSPDSIGIITPFRAQIALIKVELDKGGIDHSEITIDTVERYQGGARDIIIMSTVVNTPFQLDALVSENVDGIDRKLNVAISRARKQFILLGNQDVLEYAEQYSQLIRKCKEVTL